MLERLILKGSLIKGALKKPAHNSTNWSSPRSTCSLRELTNQQGQLGQLGPWYTNSARSLDPVLVKKLPSVFTYSIIANLCNASFSFNQCTLPVDHHVTTDQETIAGYERFEQLPTNLKSQFQKRLNDSLMPGSSPTRKATYSLLPVHQSAYRIQHSTETTLVHAPVQRHGNRWPRWRLSSCVVGHVGSIRYYWS